MSKKNQKNKTKKKRNILFWIFATIFIGGVLGMVYYIYAINKENEAFKDVKKLMIEEDTDVQAQEEIKKNGLDYYIIDGEVVQKQFKDLYLANSDIIGWVQVDGTAIDYPVMYTPTDEQYYIHKDFDKNYSFGGCIFAAAGTDIKAPSNNIISYGHHMANHSMYRDIDYYEKEDYYKEHKFIKFDTLRQTGTYEVIAAFRTKIVSDKKDGFMYYTYINNEKPEFEEYVKKAKELTPYDIPTTAEYGDQLITLSTCAYHTYNGRFVVVAKRIDGAEVNLEKKPIETITTKSE